MEESKTNALVATTNNNQNPAANTDEHKKKAAGGANKLAAAVQNTIVVLREYADDPGVYEPRISTEQRYEYWKTLQKNKKPRLPPKTFKSWIKVQESLSIQSEILDYALPRRILLNFLVNVAWDYLYLMWILIWLLALIIVKDKLAIKFNLPVESLSSLPEGTVHLPLLFSFLSQIPPCIGAFYFTHFCNDLAKCQARENFSFWAVSAVLISQYIEFAFYGGQGCSDRAGKCRFSKDEGFFSRLINSLFQVKISPEAQNNNNNNNNNNDDDENDQDFNDKRQFAGNFDEENQFQSGEDNIDWDSNTINSVPFEKENTGGLGKISRIPEEPESENNAAAEYIANIKKEKMAVLLKAKEDAMKAQKAEDAKAKEWLEWRCLTCGKQNRRPKFPKPTSTISFSEKGVYYKRMVATVSKGRAVPKCTHCFTDADYKIPDCSAHLFPHNPKPHVAFENYPKYAQVQAGVRPGYVRRILNIINSFLFGIRENATSKLSYNDWRLKLYMADRFPEIPRQELNPGFDPLTGRFSDDLITKVSNEPLEIGEIVECKLQKSEWSRCRVIFARALNMYDIKYDTGEELRFVPRVLLRLRPEKREYIYRVELCMVILIVSSPLSIAAAFIISPAILCLGVFFISSQLLLAQIITLVNYMYLYYSAGFCIIFRQLLVHIFPLFIFWLSSVIGVIGYGAGIPWMYVAALFVITKFSCLHVLYIMRPSYCTMAAFLFILTSALGVLGGSLADGAPIVSVEGYVATCCLLPGVLAIITLIVYRKWLGYIWDVSLKIRPLVRLNFDNRSFLRRLYDVFKDCLCPTQS